MNKCICTELHLIKGIKVNGFNSEYDFLEFEGYISVLISRGRLVELSQGKIKTCKCKDCGNVWVIERPEFNAKGSISLSE